MTLLEVKNLSKSYGSKQVLSNLSFCLHPQETLALVGESGCGKSTLARLLMGLETADSGEILWEGKPLPYHRSLAQRRDLQMIFQNPSHSLNPKMRIQALLEEPLKIHHMEKDVTSLLSLVGLSSKEQRRYPHELSGGQKQRVGIARALALYPKVLICDEPVSSLDLSIQAQILNLLKQLQQQKYLSYLFISHDLSVVRYMASRVAILEKGTIVECQTTEALFSHPQHQYTQKLLNTLFT